MDERIVLGAEDGWSERYEESGEADDKAVPTSNDCEVRSERVSSASLHAPPANAVVSDAIGVGNRAGPTVERMQQVQNTSSALTHRQVENPQSDVDANGTGAIINRAEPQPALPAVTPPDQVQNVPIHGQAENLQAAVDANETGASNRVEPQPALPAVKPQDQLQNGLKIKGNIHATNFLSGVRRLKIGGTEDKSSQFWKEEDTGSQQRDRGRSRPLEIEGDIKTENMAMDVDSVWIKDDGKKADDAVDQKQRWDDNSRPGSAGRRSDRQRTGAKNAAEPLQDDGESMNWRAEDQQQDVSSQPSGSEVRERKKPIKQKAKAPLTNDPPRNGLKLDYLHVVLVILVVLCVLYNLYKHFN